MAAFAVRNSGGAVSYTHLDVYKRQLLNSAVAAEYRVVDDIAGLLVDFGNRVGGVALLVEDAEILAVEVELRHIVGDQLARFKACLLYTSRCV